MRNIFKILRLLAPALLLPFIAFVVGNAAYAKAKRPFEPLLVDRAKSINQCVKDAATEVGDGSSLALNEICTCVGEKLPGGTLFGEFIKTKAGSQAFGRCLFSAKDGV